MAPLWVSATLILGTVFAFKNGFWFAVTFLAVCWFPCFSVGTMKFGLVKGDKQQKVVIPIIGFAVLAFAYWLSMKVEIQFVGHAISGPTLEIVGALIGLTVPFWMAEKPIRNQQTSPDKVFAASCELLARVGDVMEAHPGVMIDDSFLPAPKATLKQACKIVWLGAKTQEQKDLVLLAWSTIAIFQPNADVPKQVLENLAQGNAVPGSDEATASLRAGKEVFDRCAKEKAENDAEFSEFLKQQSLRVGGPER